MPSNKSSVLVVGGSIRGLRRLDLELKKTVEESENIEQVRTKLSQMQFKDQFIVSNSEVLAAVTMLGVKDEEVDYEYFSLRSLFHIDDVKRFENDESLGLDDEIYFVDTTRINAAKVTELLAKVEKAQSIIVCSPVYFGDRSSLVDTFIKLLQDNNSLAEKCLSVVSVGAKRNGGQETTNVYAIFDAINSDAFGLGNGPKTSQYGGTGCAGDKGQILEDEFGLETTYGTGRRAGQMAKVMSAYSTAEGGDSNIAVLITSDNESRDVENLVNEMLPTDNSAVDFSIINLVDYRVERCLGCKICPYPPKVENGSDGKFELGSTDYSCIIDNGKDNMELVREKLKGMDGLIVVGVNDDSIPKLIDQYQAFTERTRFIRRNNFEWMNTPFTSLIIKNTKAARDRLFGLRVMTSYLRHNMIASKPVRLLRNGDEVVSRPDQELNDFVNRVSKFKIARRAVGPTRVSYIAGGTGGYQDTSLDHTTEERI